jgi:hypothetical protein
MPELAHEIQQLFEEEARESLASGWAEVTIVEGDIGTSLHLEPVKLTAAPLEVYFDSDQLVVCSPGRNGIVREFFSEDPGEIKELVRALVMAIVNGGYVERVKDAAAEVFAEWQGPEGREEASRDVIGGPEAPGEDWRTLNYEAY